MDLSSTTGIVALAAAGVAAVALIVAVVLAVKIRRLRAAQSALLGDAGAQDLVAHASGLQTEFRLLQDATQDTVNRLHDRLEQAELELSPEEAEAVRLAMDAGEPAG